MLDVEVHLTKKTDDIHNVENINLESVRWGEKKDDIIEVKIQNIFA